MLDFRVVTFLTVCETMNYTRAAELLHITQPGVSQHIRFLEEYYDTKLFLSHKKKLELTPSGKLLYQALSTLSHDTEILKLQFSQLEHRPMNLRLGSTLTIGEFALKMPLVRYIKAHPEVNLSYQIADTQILLAELRKGEIDLALIEGYYQKQDFDSMLFQKEIFYPVCSKDYGLSDDALSLDALLLEPLIVREKGSGTRNILEHYLAEHNLSISDFRKVIEMNNLNVIRAAVTEGCGITFLFESVIRQDVQQGLLRQLPIEGFPITHDFTFLWQKNSIHGEWYTQLCKEFSMQR